MERPTTSVTDHVAASPQRVCEPVSDIGLLPRFGEESQAVEWIDGDSAVLRAQFASTNVLPLTGEWTTQSQIIEFEPPRTFAWAAGDVEGPAATWRRQHRAG